MTHTLTPGRWRGLATTSSEDRIFTILAFDQRGSYEKMLPKGTDFDTAVGIKVETVNALAPAASAFLLDPQYGLLPMLATPRNAGILLALEESGYTGDSTYRKVGFYEGWSVAKIKASGASAVKLLVYYHPESGALAEEIEGVVSDVVSQCRQHDIPLFLEPVSYSLDAAVSKSSAEFADKRPAVVKETARRLGALKPDVLKLEFPTDADFNADANAGRAACDAISEICDVPWVLLSAGVDFDVFAWQVEAACKAGASGFLAGRAIWKEGVVLPAEERARFLQGTALSRLRRLSEIAGEHARPWTDFYTPIPASGEWFKSYSS